MRKIVSTLLITAAALPCTRAVPALVWKNGGSSKTTVHRSEEITASQLLENALSVEPSSNSNNNDASDDRNKNSLSVVFMVGRTQDGAEGLTSMTMDGSLPGVASKYDKCEMVHHHVSKMESLHTVTKDCQKNLSSSESSSNNKGGENNDNSPEAVVQASVEEFTSKLESLGGGVGSAESEEGKKMEMEVGPSGMISKAVQAQSKRSRALQAARVLVVDVPASMDASRLDQAVLAAIDSPHVGSVVLSAVRSTDEVKHERDQLARRRMMEQQDVGAAAASRQNRRRLDDAGQQDDGQNNNNNNGGDQDMSGIYYVHMTPNILAGLLFTLLFIVATWIGISCMGMIAGQDCYVNKMPSIGREA